MLIIAGTLTVDPVKRDEMLEGVAWMVEASRAEAGCHEYVFTADPGDPALVRLFELWESEEALAEHFSSDHMARWQEQAKGLAITGRDIAKYTVDGVQPL